MPRSCRSSVSLLFGVLAPPAPSQAYADHAVVSPTSTCANRARTPAIARAASSHRARTATPSAAAVAACGAGTFAGPVPVREAAEQARAAYAAAQAGGWTATQLNQAGLRLAPTRRNRKTSTATNPTPTDSAAEVPTGQPNKHPINHRPRGGDALGGHTPPGMSGGAPGAPPWCVSARSGRSADPGRHRPVACRTRQGVQPDPQRGGRTVAHARRREPPRLTRRALGGVGYRCTAALSFGDAVAARGVRGAGRVVL